MALRRVQAEVRISSVDGVLLNVSGVNDVVDV